MGALIREWSYALRLLAKAPGLSLLTTLVFAIGFGLAVYMYVLIKLLAFGDLPFPEGDRIVSIDAVINGVEHEGGRISLHDFREFAANQESFETFLPGSEDDMILAEGGAAKRAKGTYGGSALFSLTGVNPQLGRAFGPTDEQAGAVPVAVLSHDLWQQFFAGDPNIIGRSAKINDIQTTIVGVMPEGFRFPLDTGVWLPFPYSGVVHPGDKPLVQIYGLLKPGVSIADANRDLERQAEQLALTHPETNQGHGVKVWPFTQSQMANSMSAIAVMIGATVFILLLVCVNVVNLLIARAGERQKEIAIRASLGAPRHRLIRQMLLESLSLALAGGLVGLLFAAWAMEWSRLQIEGFGEDIPFWWNFSITWETMLFAGVLVIGVGLVVGLVPAWRASGGDLAGFLRDGTRGAQGRRVARFTRSLVGFEILLCTALLITSGVLVRSVQLSVDADFGAQTQGVLMGRTTLTGSAYQESEQEIVRFAEQVKGELESGLDLESEAAVVTTLLPGLSGLRSPALAENMDASDKQFPRVLAGSVLPGYFDALDIRLLAGRDLLPSDDASSLPVAVINESLARQFWPESSALGKRVKLNPQDPDSPWVTVVGVSEQVLHGQPFEENRSKPVMYLPLSQRPQRELIVAVRSTRQLSSDVLIDAVSRADVDVPVWGVEVLTDLITRNNSGMRFAGGLFIAFAFLGLMLASSGIYAVTARSVQLRTHEIGVRRALGADERSIMTMLFKESGKQLAIGCGLGLLLGGMLVKMLSTVLYNFSGEAPILFTLVVLLLSAIVAVATLIPALRAVRVSPNVALHYE